MEQMCLSCLFCLYFCFLCVHGSGPDIPHQGGRRVAFSLMGRGLCMSFIAIRQELEILCSGSEMIVSAVHIAFLLPRLMFILNSTLTQCHRFD